MLERAYFSTQVSAPKQKKRKTRATYDGARTWGTGLPGPLSLFPERLGSIPPPLALLRVHGAGAQRAAVLVGADDDARGHGLRADEREFAGRGSIRKEAFACA